MPKLFLFFCWFLFSTTLFGTQQLHDDQSKSNIIFIADSFLLKTDNAKLQKIDFELNDKPYSIVPNKGVADITQLLHQEGLYHLTWNDQSGKHHQLYYNRKDQSTGPNLRHIPLWLSILPPLLAILLALLFKEVIAALFIGIWSGAFIAGGLEWSSPLFYLKSMLAVVDKYIITALLDTGHLSVIVFSLLIGGMVAIISKNGGMAGVVQVLSRYAKDAKSSQLITWILGVAIFFDDYANTLIVGNTMRSVTDKFRVSREKLAYIVDSTAAPVSAIAFITTWIGAELGYIDSGIAALDGFNNNLTPYAIFLSSLKYSFYPILTLCFVLFIIWQKKDFGPMYKAEKRARTTAQVSPALNPDEDEPNMEDLSPVHNAPLNWYNAVIPVATVIMMTIIGLLSTGFDSLATSLQSNGVTLQDTSWSTVWNAMKHSETSTLYNVGQIIGNADSYVALLWASLSGLIAAILLTMRMRIVSLIECMHFMVTGFKTMMPALIILTFAWALAQITDNLHTADFITASLRDTVSPYAMPSIVFILAALIAFSTGSSWSTMAILYPIAIPATWAISTQAGLDPQISYELLLNVIATTLAASVLGDHCSPISDTTILSSLASDCNHIDHVKTQLPYALLVGLVSLLCGFLATSLGGGWIPSITIGSIALLALYLFVHRFGKPTDN